jgi:hypothetical protein
MTTQNTPDQEPDLHPDTERGTDQDADREIDRDIETEQDEYAARTRRTLTLGAAAVGVLLAIGAVLLLTGPAAHHTALRGGTSPAPTTSAPNTPIPAQRQTPSPTANPSPTITPSHPAAPKPRVVWHGKITLNGPASDLDLDTIPPSINEREADIFGAFLEPRIVTESDDVQISVLPNPRHAPTYRQCRDSVALSGLSRTQDLSPGDVVCVKTTHGAIARLQITRGVQTSDNPIVTFTTTIWKES